MSLAFDRVGLSYRQRARARKRQTKWIVIGCVIAAGLLSLLLAWMFSTNEIQGVVIRKQWTHKVHRQTFVPAVKEDWQTSLYERPVKMPVNGGGQVPGIKIRHDTCHRKYHHTDRYACGTDSEGYTRWCNRDVYKDWCTYDTWVWETVETNTASGHDKELWWNGFDPIELGEHDRASRWSSYDVVIEYARKGEVKEHTVKPGHERMYLTWDLDEEVVLVVRNTGKVTEVVREES